MAVFVSPAEGRVTSHWGPRERHPVTGARGFHRGIDIAPPVPGQTGVPVRAAYAGTVRTVVTGRPRGDRRPNPVTGTWNTGNCVIIDGPGGGSEYYGHLATVVVAPGDKVAVGQVLGTMGASGNVSGIHLHFECWDGRSQGGGLAGGNTRDPRIDFKRHGVTPGAAYIPPKNTPGALVPPKTNPTPLPERTWLDMVSITEFNKEASRHAENVVAQTTTNILNALPGIVWGYRGKNADRDAYAELRSTRRAVIEAQGERAGLLEAVRQVSGGGQIDLDAISRAAHEGARDAVDAALGGLEADVTLTINKEN